MLETLTSHRAARVMLCILTILAALAALNLAQQIIAPLTFALVVGVVVSPVADRLYAYGIPRIIAATVLLLVVLAGIGVTLILMDPLIEGLLKQLPRIRIVISEWLGVVSGILNGIETISQEIEDSVGAEAAEPQTAIPTVRDALWLAPGFAAQVFIFVGSLFFFVLTRPELYAQAGRLEQNLRLADWVVARYFGAVTLVNIGLAIATSIVLMAIGVEYAVLWGLAAGVLNYILYLGPMLIIAGLTVAGIVQFSGSMSLLPPALFLCLNLVEANFATPLVVGRKLALNPLGVFVAIVFGLWIWGPLGAIVALPVLLWAGVLISPSSVLAEEDINDLQLNSEPLRR